MLSILMEMLYSTLTDVVPRTLALLIPLVGAFWIFKVREKVASEGKIFEIGREIANFLRSKEVRGPLEGIFSYYIDREKDKLNEPNHERALNLILKRHLFNYGREPSAQERKESAETIVALATERWHSLVPPTIKWSGRGSFYSPFGERTEGGDTYFPFGTKLYREWIERFGDIDRDLWAITRNRRYFLESLLDARGKYHATDRASIEAWLDEVDSRMRDLRPLHAKLVTQIQTIDTQIALPRFGIDVAILALYMVLLSLTGYFGPRLLELTHLTSFGGMAFLALATSLLYVAIGIRVSLAVKPVSDRHIQRRIFLPQLVEELSAFERCCVRYRPHVVDNIVSMKVELKLPSKLATHLSMLSEKIQLFNECASALYGLAQDRIRDIGAEFPTCDVNQQGFSINVAKMTGDGFDVEGIRERIENENGNLLLSAEETRSSRDILKVNLSELSCEQRRGLSNRIDALRSELRESASFTPAKKLFEELQMLRTASLTMVSRLIES